MKKPEDRHNAITQQTNEQLNQQVDELSEPVVTQLRLARQQAVAKAMEQAQSNNVRWYESKPMWALAASLFIALPLLWVNQNVKIFNSSDIELPQDIAQSMETIQTEENVATVDESDVIFQLANLSEEDFAIVEDLEFIAWLNENQAG